MISFTGVFKEFDGREVLSNITFQVNPGEFVCLTGPSGAGKSTIVHMLIRAEVPTQGVIEVDGADIAKLPSSILQLYRQRTGVVFQDYKLLPDRTVAENVSFVLEVCGEPESSITERVQEILGRLRLLDRADAFPHELSGGEKTRAALARALVHRPGILIADEPTGNIDPDQSVQILQFLREINASGTTVILATHDKNVVDALQVRVLRLEHGSLVRDSVGNYSGTSAQTPDAEKVAAVAEPSVDASNVPPRGTHVPKRSTSQRSGQRVSSQSGEAAGKDGTDTASDTGHSVKPIAI